MIVTIEDILSNDFKFDKEVENLVIDITKKLVEARKNEKGEFRLSTHPNQEFDIQIKHLGKIIMEIIFKGVKNSTNIEELKTKDPKISRLERYITHSNEHLPALDKKHEEQKTTWETLKKENEGELQSEEIQKLLNTASE